MLNIKFNIDEEQNDNLSHYMNHYNIDIEFHWQNCLATWISILK